MDDHQSVSRKPPWFVQILGHHFHVQRCWNEAEKDAYETPLVQYKEPSESAQSHAAEKMLLDADVSRVSSLVRAWHENTKMSTAHRA